MTAASGISWSGLGGTFNLRVAAIITRGDEILLCTADGLGYWFPPGGRVRFGESSDAALARELAGEPGLELPAGKLALIAENIHDSETLQHEIGMYYQVAWPGVLAPGDLQGGTELGHRFRWTPAPALGSVRFEPAGLVPILQALGDALEHVVLNRPEP